MDTIMITQYELHFVKQCLINLCYNAASCGVVLDIQDYLLDYIPASNFDIESLTETEEQCRLLFLLSDEHARLEKKYGFCGIELTKFGVMPVPFFDDFKLIGN